MATISKTVNKELDITVYTVQGQAIYEEIRGEIDEYYRGALTKYVLWDFSEADSDMLLKPDEVRKLADQVSTEGKTRRGGFDLLIVPDNLKYALARIFNAYSEILNNDNGALKTVIFRKNDDAYAWIRQDMKFGKSDWQMPAREGTADESIV